MDEFSQFSTTPTPPKKSTWFFYLILLGAALIIILALVAIKYYPEYKRLQEEKRGIPDSLLLSRGVKAAPPAKKSDYKVLPQQEITNGVEYDTTQSRLETSKQVFAQFTKEGFVAIGGSTQNPQKTIYQIGKNSEMLIIEITETSSTSAHVRIYKVNTNPKPLK